MSGQAMPGHASVSGRSMVLADASIQFPSVSSLGPVLPPGKKEEEEEEKEGFPVLSHLRIIFSTPCSEGDLCQCHRLPEPRCQAEGL